MSFQHRRKGIVGDCREMKLDADSYNDAHPNAEPIQIGAIRVLVANALPYSMSIQMNMRNSVYDPNRWRQRAEQAQAKADQISGDANLKRKLLRAAEEYDRTRRALQWRSNERA